MVDANLLGGLATGFQAGTAINQNRRQLEIQEQEAGTRAAQQEIARRAAVFARNEKMFNQAKNIQTGYETTLTERGNQIRDLINSAKGRANPEIIERAIAVNEKLFANSFESVQRNSAAGVLAGKVGLRPATSPQAWGDALRKLIQSPEEQVKTAQQLGADDATQQIAQADTLAEDTDITRAQALVAARVTSDVPTASRVVSGDSQEGKKLGIPPGTSARVQFDVGANNTLSNPQVLGAFGGGDTNISVNVGSSLRKELGKLGSAQIETVIETGDLANRVEGAYLQAAELLASGVKTGAAQPILLFFNRFAQDLGADLGAIGERLGIDFGDLSQVAKQETFRRVTTELVIEGFQKFKGNLNQKEVDIAENAFAKLGDDEESNIDAIGAGLAAIELAKQRAAVAQDAIFAEDPVTASKEALAARFSTTTGDAFLALKDQKVKAIRAALAGFRADPTQSELLFDLRTVADIQNANISQVEAFADQILAAQASGEKLAISQDMIDAIGARLTAEQQAVGQ